MFFNDSEPEALKLCVAEMLRDLSDVETRWPHGTSRTGHEKMSALFS